MPGVLQPRQALVHRVRSICTAADLEGKVQDPLHIALPQRETMGIPEQTWAKVGPEDSA